MGGACFFMYQCFRKLEQQLSHLIYLDSLVFHITLFDLISLGTLFAGLMLVLLLGFAKRSVRTANLFLGLALVAMVLKTGGLTPFLLPALGPLLYFYVRQLTCAGQRFYWKDILHFCPLLAGFWMPVWLVLLSVLIYLYLSHRLIQGFYSGLRAVLMDRPRFAFRQLERALFLLGLFCLLELFNDVFSFAVSLILIGMAVEVLLKPDSSAGLTMPVTDRSDAREKGRRFKEAVAVNRLYEDAELTLTSLAIKLAVHPHDLSRILNNGLEKNFNDFINEFRVREVVRKMQDPAFDRLTLLGIAYESGFNSKRTFNRVFKELTGKTPVEYKNSLKKEGPFDKLAPLSSIRPVILRREATFVWSHEKLNRNVMFKNYFTIAWRNLIRNKVSSFINIAGLAVGMAVAMLIGLWIWDELSFDKSNKEYNHIVRVLANESAGDGLVTQFTLPMPLSAELQNRYGSDFKQVAATMTFEQNINYNNNAFSRVGCYAESAFTNIITLDMVAGAKALNTKNALLIDESLAHTIFGNTDPIGKVIKVNNAYLQQVTGVYKDLPQNSQFSGVNFIAPVNLLFQNGGDMNSWFSNSFEIYALLNNGSDLQQLSGNVHNILYEHSHDATKPSLFLFPMRQWHLYEFKNGNVVAGRLQFVWLFGVIGVFVLLLACINFMNLSTSRSEKRAKEVGIRKAIGSMRGQLVGQFLCESFMIAAVSFVIAVGLVWLSLPLFNGVAGKELHMVWNNPLMWFACFVICLVTGLLAGSYPALYLSSFNPVKVLKGTFRAGRLAAVPRKILVVVQFTVSVTLIIGTIVVFKQIEFAKDRPIGYSRSNLISIPNNGIKNYSAFREELLRTGAVTGVSLSSSPTTGVWSSADNLSWNGKDPNRQEVFGTILVDPDFGGVVGWQMKEGRNFSKQFRSDSAGFLFNEAAIKQMGFKEPIGQTVKWHGKDWKILGVVKDMIMRSPFDPITPVVFLMNDRERPFNVVIMKLNAGISTAGALNKIETVFKKFAPDDVFNYKFADSEYAQKFSAEERTGKLASIFAVLAIFISCLGLFGVVSFVAEQRVKEIGIRKVLGASVIGIWGSLSKDFVVLIVISLFIATPVSYYFMHQWLEHYTYRTELSWWVFAVTALSAIIITLFTVSFQTIKAALANPIKSLRSE